MRSLKNRRIIKKGDHVIVIGRENKDMYLPRRVVDVFPLTGQVVLGGVNVFPQHIHAAQTDYALQMLSPIIINNVSFGGTPKGRRPEARRGRMLNVVKGVSGTKGLSIKQTGTDILAIESLPQSSKRYLKNLMVQRASELLLDSGSVEIEDIKGLDISQVDFIITDEKLPQILDEDIMTENIDEKKRKAEITLLQILNEQGFSVAEKFAFGEEKKFINNFKSTSKQDIAKKIKELEQSPA